MIIALVIAITVALNAFYVAAEFATVGARRSRVQEVAESGNKTAAKLLIILRDPKKLDYYVAACQIGITLSSLIAGAYGQAKLTPLLEPLFGTGSRMLAIIIVLVFITMLQVVLGELLPKTVALRYPERLAMLVLIPMQFSQFLFAPLIAFFNGTAFLLMNAWKLNADHSHSHVHSPEELESLYRDSAAGGLIDAAERDMLAGVLNVEERVVREIMTPRTRLVTIGEQTPLQTALQTLADSPYSRFPVLGRADDVVGVLHLRNLYLAAETTPQAPVSSIMKKPFIVAEVVTVPDLWRKLREEERHCAMVVNEYGTVAGMVTLEDALEEIFGEVQDEFDHEEEPISVLGQRVSVRGDVLVHTLNDRFALDLPTEEVDTISGLLWQELGRLPLVGDEVAVEPSGVILRIEAMQGRGVGRASFELPEGMSDDGRW